MWTIRTEELTAMRGLRCQVDLRARPAAFQEVLQGWEGDAMFRSMFRASLVDAPYASFRWETPPVTKATLRRPFEFVVLDSPELARRPDPEAFAEYLRGPAETEVVAFPNLGGDAIMIVPRLKTAPSAYGHLAAFVREAPDLQCHALWQLIGKTMLGRVGAKPVWLSTAGAGVAWLHVRLDDRPKYYGDAPYRQTP